MGIFGTIMSKILGTTPATPAAAGEAAPSAKAATAPGPAAAAPAPSPEAPPGPPVDVAAVLDALKEKATQELDWKHSIVDLMKLLSL
ncbi:MAG: DUF3597 domain-containing protein, partial [Beijerinckiaceae bacterium]|nr:DUF3597 domain-containing protein [Beijerinckiaceae bacterium]MCI0736113.1 DUF3597 domain-containing protein [Beijerinckiaceae bacterium]